MKRLAEHIEKNFLIKMMYRKTNGHGNTVAGGIIGARINVLVNLSHFYVKRLLSLSSLNFTLLQWWYFSFERVIRFFRQKKDVKCCSLLRLYSIAVHTCLNELQKLSFQFAFFFRPASVDFISSHGRNRDIPQRRSNKVEMKRATLLELLHTYFLSREKNIFACRTWSRAQRKVLTLQLCAIQRREQKQSSWVDEWVSR